MSNDFLRDAIFLKQLDRHRIKEEYVRITVLSWDEEPIRYIQGRVISGSLNINGTSSLRRTGNLTLFAEERENDLTQIDTDISINRKIKIEKGIRNTIPTFSYSFYDNEELKNKEIDYKELYGEIVWFPLGIFIIFDPSLNHTTSGVNISLSFKDKMCLLNGDAGGTLPASTELHVRNNELLDGTVVTELVTMRQIIQEAVNHFGGEDFNKIIIDDVDDQVKRAMRWMDAQPLYCWPLDATANANNVQYKYSTNLNQAPEEYFTYTQGQDIGFELVDFTYPGENGLIMDAGTTVTGILDKIIEVLGNFEYFYDVDGYFHFQEIKNYLNITATTLDLGHSNNELDYKIELATGKSVYSFDNTNLINSITNAPKYSNVKNDYVVWGVRVTEDGLEIPIRYHLAIDTRPSPIYFKEDEVRPTTEGWKNSDQDYYYGKHDVLLLDEYTDDIGVVHYNTVAAAHTILSVTELPKVGIVGKLYHVESEDEQIYHAYLSDAPGSAYYWRVFSPVERSTIYTKDWREELYYQGVEAYDTGSRYNYYYTELAVEWPKLYDLRKQQYKEEYLINPTAIDYYLDLLDDDAKVGQYKVSNIGRRSLVESNDKINCVFEPEIPDVVLIEQRTLPDDLSGEWWNISGQNYAYLNPDIWTRTNVQMGGIYNSCYNRVTELLYQYTNMNETININCLPIYYLEPNTRITVRDDAAGIYGDYMIESISLPLDYSSMMTINASKCKEKI